MPVRDLLMSASGASTTPTYVDDVFSTYLYTGTGATQSINNGIDLTKGGLTWIKSRSAATNNNLFDTVQGATKLTHSNTTAATVTDANSLTAFSSTGFTLGTGNTTGNQVNTSAATYSSWTFRKAPKFFDIVQYTGTGSVQNINHNLGSAHGCIIIKSTTTVSTWTVYHKGVNGGVTPEQYAMVLNGTNAQNANAVYWNNTAPTSTQFTVNTNAGVNTSGATYIAYVFADQAGGFGATGTDSAIACGSWTASSSDTITLGWESQWLLVKDTTAVDNWYVIDNMRGFSLTGGQLLEPNLANAESALSANKLYPTATGFVHNSFFPAGDNIIYIAIRRPNKPPTTGTSVFSPVAQNVSNPATVTTNFSVDLTISTASSITSNKYVFDRLRGGSQSSYAFLETNSTAVESTGGGAGIGFDNNTAIIDNGFESGVQGTYWNFRRAPTFFDEVCYTGNGTAGNTINHNLTVVPQLLIIKNRGATTRWPTYNATLGNGNYINLNNSSGSAADGGAYWNATSPTSTQFTVGSNSYVNGSGANYVAYLFATCAGVSYVGSYTGNGTGQSIACGFGSGGARFILIKRTDSTGDWYCYDSANGLTSSSSPYLLWDSTAAQVTGNNGVYASSGGFTLTSNASSTVNINGGSYIFLAVA